MVTLLEGCWQCQGVYSNVRGEHPPPIGVVDKTLDMISFACDSDVA